MLCNTPNLDYAELELRHIQLEIQQGRMQHLRHFADQYHCYRYGFIKRTGTADWNALLWKGVVSVEARKLTDPKLVVKEHVVPLRYIASLLGQLPRDCTTQQIAAILDAHMVFGTITKEQDALLRKNGLTSKMPACFHDSAHVWFQNPLARYHVVGIELESADP